MKKILLLICLLLLCTTIGYTQNSVTESKYCSSTKPATAKNTLSKIINDVTGANFAASKSVEVAIQKAIKTQLGSNTNVEIYPYTMASLIQGIFKSMTITSKSLNLGGFYISDFKASTVCDYNQISVKNGNMLFKENFVMQFSGKLKNSDLKKTMETTQYLNLVNSVKISAFGQTLFKLTNINMDIDKNKLKINATVMSPIFWGLDSKNIHATSGLSVENGKIKYTDIKIMNMDGSKYINSLLSLINLVNPFTFEIKLSQNTSGYTSVKNVIIKDNTIYIDGILYIPKNN